MTLEKASFFYEKSEGIILRLNIQPRSSRDEIIGVTGGRLKIKLTSPPVAGEANAKLIYLLGKKLRIPKSNIEIIAGLSSRNKEVLIHTEDTKKIVNLLLKETP